MAFASADSGATWKLIRNNYNVGMESINISPAYATDQTIYIIQTGAVDGKKLLKSSDGGATWAKVTTPNNVQVYSMSIIDANTYWVGSTTNGIQLSTSTTYALIDGELPVVLIPIPGFFTVYTAEGSIYVSTDMGVSFARLGDSAQFSTGAPVFAHVPAMFTIVPPTKTIYAVEKSTKNILKWVVGTSTNWDIEMANADLPALLTPISNLSMVNGVWFLTSVGNTTGQLWRSYDDTEKSVLYPSGFAPVTGSDVVSLGVLGVGPMAKAVDSSGNFNYYPVVTRTAGGTGEYKDIIKVYTDSLLNPVKSISPADASVQNNTQVTALGTNTLVDFSWSQVTSAKQYQYQIANDPAFQSFVGGTPTITASLSASQIGLTPGRTYYWRVRVCNPIISKWSTAVKFTTSTVSSTSQGIDQTDRIYPTQGAVITGTTITFTWGSAPAADTYEITISKNGTQVDSQTGLKTTVYTFSKLETGAQYTWAVRAISGGLAGDWVTSAFTTAIPPATNQAPTTAAATPIITVNVPPQATPTYTFSVPPASTTPNATPPYIWVIIVIGAILVIAVVVLIVRTRRV